MNDYPLPDPRPVFTGKQSRARAANGRAELKARKEAKREIWEEE